jgi:hypothetical protein
MAYDNSELRLLTDRLVADGMNHWTYDTEDAVATVIADQYISDAQSIKMSVGDKVTIRVYDDLTDKSEAPLSVTDHYVTAIDADGATLSAAGMQASGTATATAGAATLNKLQGKITTESLTTAAAGEYTLTLTNSEIAASDIVLASVDPKTSAGTPGIGGCKVTAGQVVITVTNLHASAAFDAAIQINFVVIKA